MSEHADSHCVCCLNHLVQALGACCDHDHSGGCATLAAQVGCDECKKLIRQAIHHCVDCMVDCSEPTLFGEGVLPNDAPADEGSSEGGMNERIGAIARQCAGGTVGAPADIIAIIIGIITMMIGKCPAPKKSAEYLASCCKDRPFMTGGRVWGAINDMCPQMPYTQRKLIFDTIMESGRQALPSNVVQFMQENDVP